MLTLRQLHYALAVEKTLHFKKAAELCHVSQSALSTAITELESHLGIQIFERDNKKVLVTAAGRTVLDKARAVRLLMSELEQLGRDQRAPLSWPLSLGAIPTIGPYLLPRALPAVRQAYPDLKLTIVEDTSAALVEKVRSGELDTAIIALPWALEGLLAFEFFAEDFLVVCHRDAALARNKTATSAQLHNAQVLLLSEGHCLKDHALAACRFSAEDQGLSMAGTSLPTLVQMAAGRMGVTLIPALARDALLAGNDELCTLPLREPGPHRRLAFISRPNFAGVSSIERLIELFRKALGTRPGASHRVQKKRSQS